MMEKFDNAVSLFLDNCRADELSENSIESYANTFRYLREFAVANGFDDVTTATVLKWKLTLSVSITTQFTYLSRVKSLSDFAVSCGLFDAPIVTDAIMPNAKKVAKERGKAYDHVLDEDDASKLINATCATYGRTTHTFARERAEVALMLVSGLRNIELRNLLLSDLDWEHGTLYARVTKGDKPRHAPFSLPAQKAVKAYLESGLRPSSVSADDFLFGTVGKDGKWHGLGRQQLSALVLSYTKSVLGEEDMCRSHAMRHAAASIALDSGVRMEDVQFMLGHSNLSTTAIYAQRLHPAHVAEALGETFADVYERKAI